MPRLFAVALALCTLVLFTVACTHEAKPETKPEIDPEEYADDDTDDESDSPPPRGNDDWRDDENERDQPPAARPMRSAINRLVDQLAVGRAMVRDEVTVFPLIAHGRRDNPNVETLDGGYARGHLLLPDHTNRPEELFRVAAHNRGGRTVFLAAGEMLVGGRQNRLVAYDTLVPPADRPVLVPVFPVEPLRMTYHGSDIHLDSARLVAPARIRYEVFSRPTVPVTRRAENLWQRSADLLERYKAENRTQDLVNLYYEGDVPRQVACFYDGAYPSWPARTVGLTAMSGKRLLGLEVFPSERAFRDNWRKTLTAMLATRPVLDHACRPRDVRPATRGDVIAVLRTLPRADLANPGADDVDRAPGELRFLKYGATRGMVLVEGGEVVHLAALGGLSGGASVTRRGVEREAPQPAGVGPRRLQAVDQMVDAFTTAPQIELIQTADNGKRKAVKKKTGSQPAMASQANGGQRNHASRHSVARTERQSSRSFAARTERSSSRAVANRAERSSSRSVTNRTERQSSRFVGDRAERSSSRAAASRAERSSSRTVASRAERPPQQFDAAPSERPSSRPAFSRTEKASSSLDSRVPSVAPNRSRETVRVAPQSVGPRRPPDSGSGGPPPDDDRDRHDDGRHDDHHDGRDDDHHDGWHDDHHHDHHDDWHHGHYHGHYYHYHHYYWYGPPIPYYVIPFALFVGMQLYEHPELFDTCCACGACGSGCGCEPCDDGAGGCYGAPSCHQCDHWWWCSVHGRYHCCHVPGHLHYHWHRCPY
jgi:hypothetical protein